MDARTLIVLKAAFDGRWGKLPSTNCTMIEIARPQPNWINNSSGDKYQMSKEMLFSMDDEYGLQTGCRGKTLSDYGKCFAVWMGRNRPNPRLFCPDREVWKLCDDQCDSTSGEFPVFRGGVEVIRYLETKIDGSTKTAVGARFTSTVAHGRQARAAQPDWRAC